MDFKVVYQRLSPRLKIIAYRIAKNHRGQSTFFDEEDLYQEMSVYLWNKYKGGIADSINDAYLIKGCRFYISNYIRKKRDKMHTVSIDEPINEEGDTLKDILADRVEPARRVVDRNVTIEQIQNNGFTPREKQVFSMLMAGNTVRDVAEKLGISHPMVVKYKQRIVNKWQRKERIKVTKLSNFLLK